MGFDQVVTKRLILDAAASVEYLVLYEALGGTGGADVFDLSGIIEMDVLGVEGPIVSMMDGNDRFVGGILGEPVDGGAGNDTIRGGDGNDQLDGGTGNDLLVGGNGDDAYSVDSAGDLIEETGDDLNDRVVSLGGSYTLGANLEALYYGGTGTFKGTGNALGNSIAGGDKSDTLDGAGGDDWLYGGSAADTLKGGDGNDRLDGGALADSMDGGAGNDLFIVDNVNDAIKEGNTGGTDTVQTSLNSYVLSANLENLTYTGTAKFTGTGNAKDNIIVGGVGADTLNGGEGWDILDGGGGGKDVFVFNTAIGGGNQVYLEGFSSGYHKIHLDADIFVGLALGNLTEASFKIINGEELGLPSEKVDADDRIIFNQKDGYIYYDPDGSGDAARIKFARIWADDTVFARDFFII